MKINKDKDGLLPHSEYMEFACNGVHRTCIHSDTQDKCVPTVAKITKETVTKVDISI